MGASVILDKIIYPESDGKPMGETDTHVTEILDLLAMLRHHFRDSDTYVGANMLCYYEQGDPAACYCPDVFVVFETFKTSRRIWKIWEEGKPQDVIFEVTSKKSRWEDQGTKKALYAGLGVGEYFLFDPLQEYLKPPLQGFRLHGESYAPIEPDADGALRSERLGLKLRLDKDVVALQTTEGRHLLRPGEIAIRQEEMAKELQRLREEIERLKSGSK